MHKQLAIARKIFNCARPHNNIDCAVDACRIHGNAHLVVATERDAQWVIDHYPEMADRIVALTSTSTDTSINGPLVWDVSAVEWIVEHINDDLHRSFVEVTGFHAI